MVQAQFLEAIDHFQKQIMGADQERVAAVEARLAQVEQTLAHLRVVSCTKEELAKVEGEIWAHLLLDEERPVQPAPQGESIPAVHLPPLVAQAWPSLSLPLAFPHPPSPAVQPTHERRGEVVGVGEVQAARLTQPTQTRGVFIVPKPQGAQPPTRQQGGFQRGGSEGDSEMREASEPGEVDRSTVFGVRAISTAMPSLLKPVLTEMLKSQPKRVFSGRPADFPAWKRSWEAFLETLKASAGGVGIPDKALLRNFGRVAG